MAVVLIVLGWRDIYRIMWPILVVLYYKLARHEEADMEAELGKEYKGRPSMFLPLCLAKMGRAGGRLSRDSPRRAHRGCPLTGYGHLPYITSTSGSCYRTE